MKRVMLIRNLECFPVCSIKKVYDKDMYDSFMINEKDIVLTYINNQ